MDKERKRIVSCVLKRLVVPSGYAGHHHYEQMVMAVASSIGGCMKVKEFHIHDLPLPFSMTLAVIAKHLFDGGCIRCRGPLEYNERALVEAISAYRGTSHAVGPDSLFRLAIELPVADGSSGEEGKIEPLEAVEGLLHERANPQPLSTADTSLGMPAVRVTIR
jgi:hypothetical protein